MNIYNPYFFIAKRIYSILEKSFNPTYNDHDCYYHDPRQKKQ